MKYSYILRAGLQGSGNVFIQQIISELIGREKLFNTHGYFSTATNLNHKLVKFVYGKQYKATPIGVTPDVVPINLTGIIIPLRDFRSSISSTLRKHNIPPTKLSISKKYDIFRSFYNEFHKFRTEYANKDNMLLLNYSKFFYDYDYLFDELEKFLEIVINNNSREFFKKQYSLNSNRIISDKLDRQIAQDGTTINSGIDEKTQMSGKHIGTGIPESWKSFIPLELHEFITKLMLSELVEYGWEKESK